MSRAKVVSGARAALVAGALVLACAGEAFGQSPSNKVSAEALFDEGRRLMEAGKLAEACPKLAESQRLDPGVGTLLNLALCYEKSGQTATAWATYREAQAQALAQGRSGPAAAAEKRASALLPRLSRLTITVSEPVEGLEIKRDGVVLGRPAIGVAMPVDPGKHVITATAPRRKPWGATIEVAGGAATTELTVPPLEQAPEGAVPPPPVEPPGPRADAGGQASPGRAGGASGSGQTGAGSVAANGAPRTGLTAMTSQPPAVSEGNHGSGQRIAGIITSGVGVAGLGLGGIFALVGKSRYDSSLSHCTSDKNVCDSEGVKLRSDARSAGTVATVGIGAGAALLAGGITLWLTAPRDHDAPTVGLAPSLGGAQLRGRF